MIRVPGSEVEFFQSFSHTPITQKRQVICQGWSKKGKPIYFFEGKSERPEMLKKVTISETSFKAYCASFSQCMDDLISGNVQKVVLSRIKKIEKPTELNLYHLFLKACKKYPETLVYLIQHPTEGTWFGASPEILVKRTQNTYKSVSLAGTQPAKAAPYNWGNKEILEQSYVSDHIRKVISESNCKLLEEIGPETIEAGRVSHLKTTFLYEYHGKIQNILNNLHPTPAVAGLPIQYSIDLIERTEMHQRSLYTGYIGVYDDKNADIYVNLRCMNIEDTSLNLYVGGGLTIDSKLDLEWEETELKSQTLIDLLND